MHSHRLRAKARSRPLVYSTLEMVRASLERAKRIVVLVGGQLTTENAVQPLQCTAEEPRRPNVSGPNGPQSTSQPSTSSQPDSVAEMSQAHLALANFALPHIRNSVAVYSYLTIVTCNGDGTIKRAIEHMYSVFGLELPTSQGPQADPLLIEFATRARFSVDKKAFCGPEVACASGGDGLYQAASRIIADADLLLVAGCLIDVTLFVHAITQLKKRHGTVAVFANDTTTIVDKLQPDYVLTDPMSVIFPQVFAMNPRSLWFNDGSLRTFYPGVTVITTPQHGQSVSYADSMNAVPRHTRAFAVDCGPFIPRPALSRAEIVAMSEEEIVRLCQTSPNLADTPVGRLLPVAPVYVLAANVVVKVGFLGGAHAPEAAAMTVVRQQTNIPVPEAYRFFVHGSNSYLVMEYVQGEPLDHCWEDLSHWEKVQIAFTLRNYVNQMRRIRTPQIDRQVPGPITDDTSRPLQCQIPALGEYPAGPFDSYTHLRDWMNGRLRVSQQMGKYRYTGQMFDDSEPLVFTHGDLFLRNIILGTDGRLWLIDFGCAGVYPRWFEVYGMLERTLIYPQPKLWTWTRKFAAGPYEEQERYIDACQQGMSVFLWPDPGPVQLERELSGDSV